MPFTNFAISRMLNYYFGSTSGSPPATYYFGLSTTPITAAGTGDTEPTSGSYARASATNNKTTWTTTTTSDRTIENKIVISFPAATAAWGTIVDVGAYDAATGGNLWYYWPLASPVAAQNLATQSFSASSITATFV